MSKGAEWPSDIGNISKVPGGEKRKPGQLSGRKSGMKRREFLASVPAAVFSMSSGRGESGMALESRDSKTGRMDYSTSGPSGVHIERIDLFPLRYPMTGYFKFFTGPHGSAGRAAVVVKVTASNGTTGWGQALPIAKWSYETLETAAVCLRDYFAPVLIGQNPLDIEGAHEMMDKALAPGFSTGMPITRAGIDIALHDLRGKILGLSLAQMWGRTQGKSVTLSWTVNVTSLDQVEPVMAEGKNADTVISTSRWRRTLILTKP